MKYTYHESISKQKIDKLVLEYLIHEGYQNAAIEFAKELDIDVQNHNTTGEPNWDQNQITNIPENTSELKDFEVSESIMNFYSGKLTLSQMIGDQLQNDFSKYNKCNKKLLAGFSTISQRQEIKSLVLKGNITEAISKIGQYFPLILDSNNLLHFKLLRLSLIEMIRSHKFSTQMEVDERKFLNEILTFVRCNMINKISKSYKLLKEIEFTMSLLCFRFDPTIKNLENQKELPQELKNIFNLNLRHQVFRLINKEIIKVYDDDDCDDNDNEGIRFSNLSDDNGIIKDVIKRIRNKDDKIDDLEDTTSNRSKLNNYEGSNFYGFDFQDLNHKKYSDLIDESIDDEEDDKLVKNGINYTYEIDSESIKTNEQNYMEENIVRTDSIQKNEEEIENLIKLSLESKIERILELLVLTEDKLTNGNLHSKKFNNLIKEDCL
ncbi:hypothetical protein KGF54_001588 [Candida jiufengensis]|uniref:uncharacterized protein n=1 Tax=Candida jiufengensis TaxID=497108 RepID=UPI002224F433|nr:uncharacterized protein KGF54_001588 [Candida jiufengensis]KAI5955027.1 hypothetical protein KGF54_001588 [Candida jiufengensis]